MVKIRQLFVGRNYSIKETMRQIQAGGLGIALVAEKRKLLGIVTDGDIRRAILGGISIDEKVGKIMNKKPIVAAEGTAKKKLAQLMRSPEKVAKEGVFLKIPIVNSAGEVVDLAVLPGLDESGKQATPLFLTKNDLQKGKVRKILVIGGAGYLGSVLVRKLLQKNYKVRVLDNLTYGDDGIKEMYGKKNFEFFLGDTRNIHDVVKAVSGIEAVVHLAAIVGDPACKIEPIITIESNYLATKMIAEVCKYHQVNRFVFASTCSVYGKSRKPANEESGTKALSLYARSKLDSEHAILAMADENFSPTILRLATLFGLSPRMRFDLVVNALTAKAVIDGKIPIFGGNQSRPNLHVEDAANAFIACLETPLEKISGEIFNVGSSSLNLKIIEIGRAVKRIVPKAELVVDRKDTDRRDYIVDFKKIETEVGFRVNKKIEAGIEEVREWIIANKINSYAEKKYSNYERLSEPAGNPLALKPQKTGSTLKA